MGNTNEIMNSFKVIKNNNFGKVIKIYIFKLFYYYMNNNFESLKNYNYNAYGIKFYNDFPSLFREKDDIMLTYFFMPLDNETIYNNYLEELNLFEEIRIKKFNTTTKEMAEKIKQNGLDVFLIISINKIISNLSLKNYIKDKDEYQNFSSFIKSLFFSNYELTPELKELLLLFYDEHKYMEIIREKLAKKDEVLNQQKFEILLYGFRFCVSTLSNKNKNDNLLFSSFFKKEAEDLINKSLIPGIDNVEDFHLITLNNIEEHFNNFEDEYGCYICECGFYHYLLPDGFPPKNLIFDCPNCHKKLGWDNENKKMYIFPSYSFN